MRTKTSSNFTPLDLVKIVFRNKKSILFLLALFLGRVSSFAQDQFLWTGAINSSWIVAGNWLYLPYGDATAIPAPYYPGQNGGGNAATKDDIAIFTNNTTANCNIDLTLPVGSTSGLRIGGIHVNGYQGTITQMNLNRFIVAEENSGFWDGVTTISSTYPDVVTLFNGTTAYRAYFKFSSPSLGFIGSASSIGPPLNYELSFSVPLIIENNSKFKAPVGTTSIRNDATIVTGADFDNSNNGTVTLSNRSGGLGVRYYDFGNVKFYDLKVTPNGASPRQKEFIGAACTVENNFMTTGLNGVLGGGSVPVIMNGTEIHIKKDIIVGNVFLGPTYITSAAFGNILLVLDGDVDQRIEHTYSSTDFSGNLPAIRIDKPSGDVILKGPITVNNKIEFIKGIVIPDPTDPVSTQNDLTLQKNVFVLNSNTTVLACSDDSYCEGPIRCRTGKSIELPLGKSGSYRPMLINAISGLDAGGVTNMYMAEYFNSVAVVGTANREPDLLDVSDCEVWGIQKYDVSDSYQADLEPSFDDMSCTDFLNTNNCKLVVTRWDDSDSKWLTHGNDGFYSTGCSSDQTIRTATSVLSADFERSISQPDLFTFGYFDTPGCDTCDVELYANYCVDSCIFTFDPIIDLGMGGVLHSILWDFGVDGTSNLLNPTVDFSSPGLKTITVTVEVLTETDTCTAQYVFKVYKNDCNTSTPIITSSKTSGLRLEKLKSLKVIPNPSYGDQVKIELETSEKGRFNYMITNSQGERMMNGTLSSEQLDMINTSNLSPGMYLITVYLSNQRITEKLMIGN